MKSVITLSVKSEHYRNLLRLSKYIFHTERGGEVLSKVLNGEASPEVQTLTLLYTISDRKGNLFIYLQ